MHSEITDTGQTKTGSPGREVVGVSEDVHLTEQQMLGTSLPGIQLQLCIHREDLIKGRCALRHQKEVDDLACWLHLNDVVCGLLYLAEPPLTEPGASLVPDTG